MKVAVNLSTDSTARYVFLINDSRYANASGERLGENTEVRTRIYQSIAGECLAF
jgi:hypothetical protein